jgi:hypothetical protein
VTTFFDPGEADDADGISFLAEEEKQVTAVVVGFGFAGPVADGTGYPVAHANGRPLEAHVAPEALRATRQADA